MFFVSVIIPTYNSHEFVRSAIDSALTQTHTDREVIVVDDGSTDRTSDILTRYGERIRVIRQANRGTAAACNAGVAAARGEWVAFLDADDEWLPSKLAAHATRCPRFAISHSDSVCFGETLQGEVRRSCFEPLYGGRVLEHLLVRNFITKSSVVMRRETFVRHGGFSDIHGAVEDWPLWMKVCAEHELGFVPESLVRYRVHQNSKSMKARATLRAHIGIIADAFAAGGPGEGYPQLRRAALASSYGVNSYYAAESNDWIFAARCALGALRYQPANIANWKSIARAVLNPLRTH